MTRRTSRRSKNSAGTVLTGIENVCPEIKQIYTAPVDPDKLPFDMKEVWEYDLPWTPSDM